MDFELRFSDRQLTPFAGISLLKKMLEHLNFDCVLQQCGLPQQGSNRGFSPLQLINQFLINIWCGGNRFEHAEMIRYDTVIQQIFGFKRMANFKAIIRLFKKFNQVRNNEVFGALYRWIFNLIAIERITLDLDSTIMTRYGAQEGANKGYNPKHRGRNSHHPLMAFVAEPRLIANCWLRPGNSGSAHNVKSFLDTTIEYLGNKKISLLRADSGFSEVGFINYLEEEKHIHYIIALKLNYPIQRELVKNQSWWVLDNGIEITNFMYQANIWDKARRVVGIRQSIKIKADAKGKQLSLFANDETIKGYRYAALVTDLEISDLEVWRTYRNRADCENRSKEVKYDFGLDSFNMRDFWATEACINMAIIGYNLMSIFRQAVVRADVIRGGQAEPLAQTLRTLRYKLFAKAGYISKSGRKKIINIAIPQRHREWFEGLWNRTKSFELPMVFTPAFTS